MWWRKAAFGLHSDFYYSKLHVSEHSLRGWVETPPPNYPGLTTPSVLLFTLNSLMIFYEQYLFKKSIKPHTKKPYMYYCQLQNHFKQLTGVILLAITFMLSVWTPRHFLGMGRASNPVSSLSKQSATFGLVKCHCATHLRCLPSKCWLKKKNGFSSAHQTCCDFQSGTFV